MIFQDRRDAGQKLAEALQKYANDPNAIVIALPRGGVVVGYEIAKKLSLPLDIVSPRKIGAPMNPEYAIGAITETGKGILSTSIIESLGIPQSYITEEIEKEKKEALRRLNTYRSSSTPRNVKNKRVIIVDDGLATGSTMLAAIETLKAEGAKQIIVAVPVGPLDTIDRIRAQVDDVVCLTTPSSLLFPNFTMNSTKPPMKR